MGELLRFRRLRRAAPGGPGRAGPYRLRAARRGGWRSSLAAASFAFVASALGYSALVDGRAAFGAAVDAEQARFARCQDGSTPTCVIDGDTFRYRGETIRIADIDTPEVRDFACTAEKEKGDAATRRLVALLNDGAFTLAPYERERDRYGRALRIVTRDGKSLGMVLVTEGHARAWDGARRGWC